MIIIKNYDNYRAHIKAFKKKKLNLLTIVSRGGLGKTFISEEELIEEAPLVFTGHVTPMSLYKALYAKSQEEEDFIVVFDDVDTLMMNKTNVALLKQVCDTREVKTIKYFTASPMLGSTPPEFETKCKVLMLMNDLNPDDNNMKALMTRSHLIHFLPPDVEILRNLRTFGNDRKVLEFIKIYTPFSTALNLRVYKRAIELKESGLDWKKSIISDLNVDQHLLEIYNLLQTYKTDKERELKFSSGRATYYRKKKFLISKNPQLSKHK